MMFVRISAACAAAAAIALAAFPLAATAATIQSYDLTSSESSAIIQSARFAGSAPIHADHETTFVRLQDRNGDGREAGYNTQVSPEVLTGSRLVKASDLSEVNISGQQYMEFTLDAAEPGGSAAPISLDSLKIYLTDQQNVSSPAAFASPVFDLDAGQDRSILLQDRTSGHGFADLVVDVPAVQFTGKTGTYVYLYSELGQAARADGSYEAWSAGSVTSTPEPAALALALPAIMGLCGRRRARRS